MGQSTCHNVKAHCERKHPGNKVYSNRISCVFSVDKKEGERVTHTHRQKVVILHYSAAKTDTAAFKW